MRENSNKPRITQTKRQLDAKQPFSFVRSKVAVLLSDKRFQVPVVTFHLLSDIQKAQTPYFELYLWEAPKRTPKQEKLKISETKQIIPLAPLT